MRQKKAKPANVVMFIILVVFAIVFIFPILFILMNSFKGKLFISDNPFSMPKFSLNKEEKKGYGIVIPAEWKASDFNGSLDDLFAQIVDLDIKAFYRMAESTDIDLIYG